MVWSAAFLTFLSDNEKVGTQHIWNVVGLRKKCLGASKWVNPVFIIKNTSDEKVKLAPFGKMCQIKNFL